MKKKKYVMKLMLVYNEKEPVFFSFHGTSRKKLQIQYNSFLELMTIGTTCAPLNIEKRIYDDTGRCISFEKGKINVP